MPTLARPRSRGLPWRRRELGCGQSGSCSSRNPRDLGVVFFFSSFWALARFSPASLWIQERIHRQRGAPPGKGWFFFPFLGKDARAEQQGAAETGPEERPSPAFPLPARGPPAGDDDTGAPPGKRGQEALTPISGTGWPRTEKQHRRGAAPVGDERRPTPSIPAPGQDPAATPRHSPWRILRGPHIPKDSNFSQHPTLDAVARRNPLPHPPLTLFSPLRPSLSPRSP